MLFRSEEPHLDLAVAGRPWAFDAPGEAFKLAAEAYCIDLAYLFDPMMAVHTAKVKPLPHQITAVYASLLPRQPLRYLLATTRWALVVVDEAHKLSANYYGTKLNKTKRFLLGELLGSITRHFLLMTATPHNGKEEDFQVFLSLLDADRFYGKFRDGAHKVDVSDLMRRMVKEEMRRFDGSKLFPPAPRLHRQLPPLRPRGGPLRRGHRLRQDRVRQGRSTGRRQAQGHRRLRPHHPETPPGLQPRGHLPVPAPPPA